MTDSGWQPIGTAPKDGRRIIDWVPGVPPHVFTALWIASLGACWLDRLPLNLALMSGLGRETGSAVLDQCIAGFDPFQISAVFPCCSAIRYCAVAPPAGMLGRDVRPRERALMSQNKCCR